jgi:membrane associated rhomboid family serine protease
MLEEAVVAATADERTADEWVLVLAAAGVAYRLTRDDGIWRLLVAADDAARAAAALDAYRRDEERRRPAPAPAPAEYGPTAVGMVVAAVLVAAAIVTGTVGSRGRWGRAGALDVERVRAGELWRPVTALTLHAGPAHLVGNLAGAVVFVTPVGRALGPGLGAALVLAAGAAGNAMNVLVHPDRHVAVGASTAVFGAVGILGGLQAMRRRRERRPWLPIAGALALLALLGSDPNADLGAHLAGLGAGLVLGLIVAPLRRPPGAAVQGVLGASAAAVLLAAWVVALGWGA